MSDRPLKVHYRSNSFEMTISTIGAVNQMERELKAERASAGRASANARGKGPGGGQRLVKKY